MSLVTLGKAIGGKRAPGVQTAAASFTSSSGIDATMPAGVADGDRLLMFIHCYQGSGNPAATGWTQIATFTEGSNKSQERVLTKTASGEGATVPVTGLVGFGNSSVTIVRCAGSTVNTQAADATFDASLAPAPSITTTIGGARVIGHVSVNSTNDGSTFTPPAGTIEHLDTGAAGNADNLYVIVFSYEQAAAGATGTKTPTFSGTGAGYGSAQVALV